MQAALLSTVTALLFLLIVSAFLLRSSLIDAASELAANTRAIDEQTIGITAARSRQQAFAGPVQCSFPKMETVALEEPLIERPSKAKGKPRK